MKKNPHNTRGFFTLLAFPERSRRSTAFQSNPDRPSPFIGSKDTWLPRIKIAPPLRNPIANLLTQQRRQTAA